MVVAREEFHSDWPVRQSELRLKSASHCKTQKKQAKQTTRCSKTQLVPTLSLSAVTRQQWSLRPIRFQRRLLSDADESPEVALDDCELRVCPVLLIWWWRGEEASRRRQVSVWEGAQRKEQKTNRGLVKVDWMSTLSLKLLL